MILCVFWKRLTISLNPIYVHDNCTALDVQTPLYCKCVYPVKMLLNMISLDHICMNSERWTWM